MLKHIKITVLAERLGVQLCPITFAGLTCTIFGLSQSHDRAVQLIRVHVVVVSVWYWAAHKSPDSHKWFCLYLPVPILANVHVHAQSTGGFASKQCRCLHSSTGRIHTTCQSLHACLYTC